MTDVKLYPLSPLTRHLKPTGVEVKVIPAKGESSLKTISVEEALVYVIRRFIRHDEEFRDLNYNFERILFEDGSNCYVSWFVQMKFKDSKDTLGCPHAVYLCAGASKGETIMASMLAE